MRNHVLSIKVMSLKIYFAGSIRAGRADVHIYAKIVDVLKKYGSVLTEHVGNPNMTEKGSHNTTQIYIVWILNAGDVELTDKEIHDRDVNWLIQSDGRCYTCLCIGLPYYEYNNDLRLEAHWSYYAVLVAEVTQVSLGVGYELGRAVAMGKKTLCLYRPQPDKSE